MKRTWLAILLGLLLFCTTTLADDAGVLTETELTTWLNQLLTDTATVAPLNAPIDEKALTEDGYAFLYDWATLYYNRPTLDAQSVLNAVAVTDEALLMPRDIRLGASAQQLLTAYGWQNPSLAGDASFAPLYVLNQLPTSAYWAWAQRNADGLQSVQCAIHTCIGQDQYTDTGIIYNVSNGVVASIRVYGIHAQVTLAEVESNLSAVEGVTAAINSTATQGVTLVSGAAPFEATDMQFAEFDFLTLAETEADALFGIPNGEAWAQEDSGRWLHTLAYTDAALVFAMDQNRGNAQLESITLSGERLHGPRGLVLGITTEEALTLFRCDGAGATSQSAALLYGDGETPPFGTLERNGEDATLRYGATLTLQNGITLQVALHLAFTNDRLTELMMYTF